ncbi:MAG: hypothetical protein AVDCRST_MAG93-5761 [uncultured Chloroflexia bacterium]|uniref:Bacterial transcriptional activator domain-containing protein n=1 Tax=uncultured Chloroflexia bacterium TaxID=1672391 RepID=A0A6J4L4S5_9CHLR|nr:MAG: hypothetical protein AVDCRST_MAG93-5761 [uncultured Chloroflexia bacterium]
MGELCTELGDNSTAATSLADAEQLYRDLGAWGDVGYVRAALGDIAFYDGEYAEARAQYREALRLFRAAGNRRLIGRALGRLGQIAVRMRDLVNAAQLCAQGLTLRREIGHTGGLLFSLDRGYIELAVAVGRPTVAAALLGAVEAARDALGHPRLPMEERDLVPIIAQVRTELGDERFGSLRNEGRMMSLDQAATYALDSLSPAEVSRPRPALRIFALGPLRVYSGDRLLTSADWTYAKARELVLYLLCHPTATREQIGVALWPDASTAQVRQRLSAALAHARGALGRQVEWITLVNGRYQFNRARPYWFDVEVFEDRLRTAYGLLRTDAQDQRAVALLEEAVNLYDKDFAEDLLESDWPTVRREALHATYLEALLTLGRLHTAAGRDEQAIAVYQRALARDPYLEDAHHNVIAAYARLDKRRQAFAQYTTLQAVLAELGTTASDKTTALIERLKQRAAL